MLLLLLLCLDVLLEQHSQLMLRRNASLDFFFHAAEAVLQPRNIHRWGSHKQAIGIGITARRCASNQSSCGGRKFVDMHAVICSVRCFRRTRAALWRGSGGGGARLRELAWRREWKVV
jgi:hypothetical protein